jgi:hypothetical protein
MAAGDRPAGEGDSNSQNSRRQAAEARIFLQRAERALSSDVNAIVNGVIVDSLELRAGGGDDTQWLYFARKSKQFNSTFE